MVYDILNYSSDIGDVTSHSPNYRRRYALVGELLLFGEFSKLGGCRSLYQDRDHRNSMHPSRWQHMERLNSATACLCIPGKVICLDRGLP